VTTHNKSGVSFFPRKGEEEKEKKKKGKG